MRKMAVMRSLVAWSLMAKRAPGGTAAGDERGDGRAGNRRSRGKEEGCHRKQGGTDQEVVCGGDGDCSCNWRSSSR